MSLVMEELKLLDSEMIELTGFDMDELNNDDVDFDDIDSTEDREKKFKDELVTCPHCKKSFTIKI